MTTLGDGSIAFDMEAWDLSDLENGTPTTQSAGEADIAGAGGTFTYAITGTGFSDFDGHGLPRLGIVTGFSMSTGSGTPLTISGFSLDADTFAFYVETDNVAALKHALFAGNDNFIGSPGNDSFVLSNGGNDAVNAGDGNDILYLGATLTAADTIDGGAGSDAVVLSGNYSAGVVFTPTTMTNVESLVLRAGHNYNITTDDATVAAGQILTINADKLDGNSLIFNGSAETDGAFRIVGGRGDNVLTGGAGNDVLTGGPINDILTGGAGNDVFNLLDYGSNTVYGGDGNDVIKGVYGSDAIDGGDGNDTIFSIDPSFSAAIDGGAGNDKVSLTLDGGTFSTTLSPTAMTNVETLVLAGDPFSYQLKLNNATVAPGATLHINLANLSAESVTAIDGSQVTDGNLIFTGSNIVVPRFAPNYNFTGGAGNDVFHGGPNAETFNLSYGGRDIADGNGGNDTFEFSATQTGAAADGGFSSADRIDGGSGNDLIEFFLASDFVFKPSAAAIISVEALSFFDPGHNVKVITNDALVAAGQTLKVGVDEAASFDFDGSAETDGNFDLNYGTGLAHFTGGAGNDVFTLNLAADDRIDGGAGNDTVVLDSNYSAGLRFEAGTIQNVETIVLDAGHSYRLTSVDANVAAGQTLTIDGHALLAANRVLFNGARETNGNFVLLGGAGDDILVGGAGADSLTGGAGADKMAGGGGADTFVYNAATDSTSSLYDTITGFDASADKFHLWTSVTGVDAAITSGALSRASFDFDLSFFADAAHLAAHTAVIFTPNAGTLAGDTFLIVDTNGTAGYQSGQDLVIQLASPANLASLGTGNFT